MSWHHQTEPNASHWLENCDQRGRRSINTGNQDTMVLSHQRPSRILLALNLTFQRVFPKIDFRGIAYYLIKSDRSSSHLHGGQQCRRQWLSSASNIVPRFEEVAHLSHNAIYLAHSLLTAEVDSIFFHRFAVYCDTITNKIPFRFWIKPDCIKI
jgi:hypothetical protein